MSVVTTYSHGWRRCRHCHCCLVDHVVKRDKAEMYATCERCRSCPPEEAPLTLFGGAA